MKITLFLCLTGFAIAFGEQCSCGLDNISSRIMGGRPSIDHAYPWMVFVVITRRFGLPEMTCGGSIINNKYIMTAAHCIQDAREAKVVYGTNKVWQGMDMIPVEIIKHEDYNKHTFHNDIALLKLKTPITFSRTVRPICLPPKDMNQNGSLVIAGWGKSEVSAVSPMLLEATVEEYDFNTCANEWKYKGMDVTDKQFCAGLIGKGSCFGDSGGPMTKRVGGKTYAVGVVSFGNKVCVSSRGTVYTKVTSYLDWIKRKTADGEYCSS